MKILAAILTVTALLVGDASAQYSSAKRQASSLEGKINERHRAAEDGAPPPGLPPRPGSAQPATPPASAPQPPPASAPIKPTSQQLAASKLKADIAEAHKQGAATAELKKQFAGNLAAAVSGSSRPSAAALAKFGDGLLSALAAKNVSLAEDTKLIKAIVTSLNSKGLSATRLQEINDEVQGWLTKAGVPAGDATLNAQNLAGVVAEVQNGPAS